jgi:streptogramin lyase
VTQVFFTEYASNKIARFDTSNNNFTEWQLPAGSKPIGLYVDENADIWFTESGRDVIGRLTPSTSSLTEWILPGATSTPGSPNLKPWGIYVQVVIPQLGGSNRFVWFTESSNNKIGRLEANSNRLTLWDLNSLGLGSYQPTEITLGTLGGLPVAVFANTNANRISVLGNDTGGGSVYRESLIPTNAAQPQGVAFDPSRNAFWFAENNVGNIANLNTTSTFVPQLLSPVYCTIAPAAGSPSCTAPATTTSSTVGFTVSAGGSGNSRTQNPAATSAIIVYQGPINGVTEYRLPYVTSRPASLTLDAGGNIWLTESNVTINRIARLSIPAPSYAFQVTASPNTQTVSQGQTAIYPVTVTLLSGNPSPAALTLLNGPPGSIAQFNPQTANPPFTSTLTITTSNSTPTGTYLMSIRASSAGQNQSAPITLVVQARQQPPPPPQPTFDYTITVTSTQTANVPQGQSASFDVTVTLTSGSPQSVALAVNGLPTGVTYSFTVASGMPYFTSTLQLQTDPNTPAGSYSIIISGVSSGGTPHQSTTTPLLVVTEAPRDFRLTAPLVPITLAQASRTYVTLTVTSIGDFNGNVAFSGTISPSIPGLTISFSPSSVAPQPNGGVQQTTMEIVAEMNTPGTYMVTVTGTSTTPSRAHQAIMYVRVSPCLIATATFGSELAPEVQFLRDFRDQQITSTFAGSNFMKVFNSWYYSFSPTVAQFEYSHATVRQTAKVALHPLIGVLHLASSTYTMISFQPELAALVAGLTASSLIGLVFFAIPMFPVFWLSRNRFDPNTKSRVARWLAAAMASLIVGFMVSEIFLLPALMMFVSAGLILTALGTGSVLPTLEIVEHFRKTAHYD